VHALASVASGVDPRCSWTARRRCIWSAATALTALRLDYRIRTATAAPATIGFGAGVVVGSCGWAPATRYCSSRTADATLDANASVSNFTPTLLRMLCRISRAKAADADAQVTGTLAQPLAACT